MPFWPATDRRLRVLTVIGIAALTSTFLCSLLLQWLFTAEVWAKLFYLRWFLFPAFAGFWGAVLYPLEIRAVAGSLKYRPALASLAQLAVLVATAAVLVSCGDFAFEWAGPSAVGAVLRSEEMWKRAWATNALILFAAYALTFALTRRLIATVILISPLYLGFVLANIVKINYLDVAVQPLDVLRIPEFLPFFRSFFGTAGVVALVCGLAIWIGGLTINAGAPASHMNRTSRWVIGVMALAILLSFSFAFSQGPLSSSQRILHAIGAPKDRGNREHARRHGVLLAFLSNLSAAFVSKPNEYSPMAVKDALARNSPRAHDEVQTRQPVNLVLYMVESMMDPYDFGVRYTSDPIPTMRSLRGTFPGGWAIVPEAFGGSVSTEFEVLTGMSMCFLPELSLAFRQYLRHPIPSLPRALKESGYRTTAVVADPKYFFTRERAYDMLGFDDVRWLYEAAGIERAARDPSPADAAIVDAIIEISRQPGPLFVFAFPASTHAPYTHGTYRDTGLEVAESLPEDARSELHEYVNAIRVADQAIAKLIEHFRHQQAPTMIVILGDHLPPFSSATRGIFVDQLSGMSATDRSLRSRRVPLALWANFPLQKEDLTFSTNALASYILRKLNVEPSGFLAVNDAIRRTIPVLGNRVPECGWGAEGLQPLDPAARVLVGDYKLLQYDLLLGRNYSSGTTRTRSNDRQSR